MILDDMTDEERYKRFQSEWRGVKHFFRAYDKKFHKEVMKRSVFPVISCREFVSDQKSQWIACTIVEDKRFRDKFKLSYYMEYTGKRGIEIMHNQWAGENKVFLMPKHLWERYRERYIDRYMPDGNYKDQTLVFGLLTYNPTAIIENVRLNEVEIYILEGMITGEWITENICICKTFLGREDMYELQTARYAAFIMCDLEYKILDYHSRDSLRTVRRWTMEKPNIDYMWYMKYHARGIEKLAYTYVLKYITSHQDNIKTYLEFREKIINRKVEEVMSRVDKENEELEQAIRALRLGQRTKIPKFS